MDPEATMKQLESIASQNELLKLDLDRINLQQEHENLLLIQEKDLLEKARVVLDKEDKDLALARADYVAYCQRFLESQRSFRFDTELDESKKRCVGILQQKIDLQKELLEIQQITSEFHQANMEKASLETRNQTALKLRHELTEQGRVLKDQIHELKLKISSTMGSYQREYQNRGDHQQAAAAAGNRRGALQMVDYAE